MQIKANPGFQTILEQHARRLIEQRLAEDALDKIPRPHPCIQPSGVSGGLARRQRADAGVEIGGELVPIRVPADPPICPPGHVNTFRT